MSTVQQVPCSRIVPGNNDRKVFDQGTLEDLAASIEAHGLAQPITVRPVASLASSPHYQIVAGERRFRAIAHILGLDTVPAIVRDLSDEEASAIMLAENTGRADLNPIEEANAYQSRIETMGWPTEKVAKIAGVSKDLVKRRVSLLSLADDIQHLVAHGHLPIGHAEAMTKLDGNRQRIALRIFRESKNGMPLSHFHPVVGQLFEEQSQAGLFDLENFWVEQAQAGAELPRKGKRAVTGAPTRKDLPAVHIEARDTAAIIIDRYIAQLITSGHDAEAAVIGNVYAAMVHKNYMAVPPQSALLA